MKCTVLFDRDFISYQKLSGIQNKESLSSFDYVCLNKMSCSGGTDCSSKFLIYKDSNDCQGLTEDSLLQQYILMSDLLIVITENAFNAFESLIPKVEDKKDFPIVFSIANTRLQPNSDSSDISIFYAWPSMEKIADLFAKIIEKEKEEKDQNSDVIFLWTSDTRNCVDVFRKNKPETIDSFCDFCLQDSFIEKIKHLEFLGKKNVFAIYYSFNSSREECSQLHKLSEQYHFKIITDFNTPKENVADNSILPDNWLFLGTEKNSLRTNDETEEYPFFVYTVFASLLSVLRELVAFSPTNDSVSIFLKECFKNEFSVRSTCIIDTPLGTGFSFSNSGELILSYYYYKGKDSFALSEESRFLSLFSESYLFEKTIQFFSNKDLISYKLLDSLDFSLFLKKVFSDFFSFVTDGFICVDEKDFSSTFPGVSVEKNTLFLSSNKWHYCHSFPFFFNTKTYMVLPLKPSVYPPEKDVSFYDAVILQQCVDRIVYNIYNLIKSLSLFLANTKSAIGSIMSRNGSHNIGSHVLSTLTHHVGTMPDDRVLYQYIQQRMDYIATITTDIPNWGASTMFVGDMMKTFFSQHHLLEFISGSEGLHAYSFQDPNLSLELRRKQENTIKLHIRRIGKGAGKLAFNKDFKKTEEKTDWDDVANAKANALHFICYPDREKIHFFDYVEDRPIPLQEDTTLSIPGGVVGEHAFFTILENVIRNAAKHGWATSSKKEKNLEIYIDFIDNPDSDFVEFTIWDNMSDVLKPIKKSEGGSAEKYIKLYIKLFKVLASVKDKLSAEIDISESNGDSSNALAPKKPTRSEWIKKKFKGLAGKIGDISEENTEPDSDLLSDFEKNLDDILKNNRREFEQILCKPLTREEIRMITRAKKEARDFDKCLPLHMCQQQLLEQPLITEQGELRRENWGLAEMRISAGYLQQRSITEIGGLEELKDDDFIVHVVAMPGVCTCESNQNGGIRCDAKKCDNKTNCPIESKLYHLGYRFKVWKPREMLIVFDETDDNYSFGGQKIAKNDLIKMLPEFKKNGVYFAVMSGNECILINSTESLNATDQSNKGIVITEFNFGYVVFSNKETAEKCGTALLEKNSGNIDSASRKAQEKTGDEKNEEWKSQFPFRLLYENLKIELNNSSAQKNIQSVKNAVYAAWLEKLQKFRALPGNKDCLTMQIQTEERGNASAGQGLITNRNLLEYVFRKNYLPVLSRQSFSHIENDPYTLILDLLKLYPQPYKKIPDQKNWEDDISRMIRITLQRICEDFERSYYDIRALIRHSEFVDGAKSEDDKKEFCGVIYEQINGQRDGARLKNAILNIPESVFCERIRAFSIASKGCGNDEIRKLLRGETSMKHASPFAVLVDSPVEIITKELKNAYDISDSLLRKYEERITTLPHGYSINQTDGRESKKSVMKELNKNLSQVHIKLVGDGDNPRIKYCRHDKDCPEGCLYAEALSGSQSYLNTLHRIMHPSDSSQSQDPEQKDSIGMFVRLAENALMRVLIIDERVSNFLKDHTANKSVFEAMKIDVVDIQEDFFLKEDDLKCPSRLPLLKNTKKTPAASERRWDILIIHQGIIDKVLEDHHDENHVEELINEIKYVDYKVVTTGRGRPDNIPNSVKVLPFSMIEGTLFRNYPEKMLLVNAVMNALPSSRNKH